ncbi:hypothetical protein LXL04_008053 [Taraxacum kok-saghyz]
MLGLSSDVGCEAVDPRDAAAYVFVYCIEKFILMFKYVCRILRKSWKYTNNRQLQKQETLVLPSKTHPLNERKVIIQVKTAGYGRYLLVRAEQPLEGKQQQTPHYTKLDEVLAKIKHKEYVKGLIIDKYSHHVAISFSLTLNPKTQIARVKDTGANIDESQVS